MPTEQEELRQSLYQYNYQQALLVMLGSFASSVIMTAILARPELTPELTLWFTAQVVFTSISLILYRTHIRDALDTAPRRAHSLIQFGAVMLGLLWGAGGILWPLSAGDVGIAMMLCTLGLAAAGSSSSAADPAGLLAFNLLAFGPRFVAFGKDGWWLSALLFLYVATTIIIMLRNHHLLKASLALRFSNTRLLDQARTEQQAALAEKQRAESAVASRTRFLAAASHDLRQPVQALSLFADVLAQQTDETKRAQAIEAVGRTSRALAAMLESLLDISRLDAGVVAPSPVAVSLRRLLEDTSASLQDDAEKRGMVVQVAGPPCHAFADRTMLERVVQNLAVNAVRHGDGRVLLAARRRGEHCLVQVWDQGPGIAEADRERIFDELVQLANQERDRQKGLGLGLSMVRRLCELNGWPLTLHSRVGSGTVFTVQLPRVHVETQTLSLAQAPTSRDLTVLLVEDDPDVREATTAFLAGQGCTLCTAANGPEALLRWNEQRSTGVSIDILITDHGLPGPLSGAELALELRKQQPDLPIVMVTGAESLPFGDAPPPGLALMKKPVKGDALWRTMRDVLDSSRISSDPGGTIRASDTGE